jgi:hypothetical protein
MILAAFRSAPPAPIVTPPRSALGIAAELTARGQIGRGEQGGNNVGPDLDRYRNGGPGGAWCAAFVSWCIEEAARHVGPSKSFTSGQRFVAPKRSHGAKKLFANCLKVGQRVDVPAPGDIVLWHRGAKGARTGHIGIVSRVDGGEFWSIEGNKGGGKNKAGVFIPSKVREFNHEIGEALLLGFARLP